MALLARAALSADTGLRLLDRDLRAQWIPWPDVATRAARAAAWLRRAGVGHGDRVGLVFPTGAAFFDAFFGVLLAGAVPAPVYPPVRLGRLDEYRARTADMLAAAEVCLLLTDRRLYRVLGEVVLRARPRLGCLVLPEVGASPELDVGDWDPFEALADDAPRPEALALIQFSSGTTRAPRPVALTHRAVVAQAVLLNSYWPDTPALTNSGVSWLPLYHDMGLIGCVFTALERPGTLTLIPPELFVTRPAVWLQAISRYRATISPAPNFAYSLAAQRVEDHELQGVDLTSWRIALCGAETVVPDVLRRFTARFARWGLSPEALTPVYGLSEAALAVTFSDPARPFLSRRFDRSSLTDHGIAREDLDGREIVSVGRAVPGFTVRVCGPDGEPLPEGQVGLVECHGPSLMEGYLGGHDDSAFRDGWLRTGDLGFLWQEELYLTGRRKDMLLVRGANHAPEEVEQAVQGVDGVRPGCAVAVGWLPEGADGERLAVFVEARRDVTEDRYPVLASACTRAVVAACSLVPDEVVVLPAGSLPRTSSGKLRRQDTLALHLRGTLSPPAAVTPARMAGAIARSALAHARARLRTGARKAKG
jgi:fatty-acyl-CoA synthase